MVDVVIAAVVTATGTLAGAVAGALITSHKKDREVRKVAESSASIVKSFKESLRDCYGFNAATVYSRSEIVNLTGDSITTRGWKGIKVNKGFALAYIPGRLQVFTPGGTIASGPRLENVSQFPKATTLSVVQKTATLCEYRSRLPAR